MTQFPFSELPNLLIPFNRIIGGQPVPIENYNWQISMLYENQHFCGATILSPVKLLTAAHCTYKIRNINKLQIRAGSSDPNRGGVLRAALRIIQHPNFNQPTGLNNDIAIVILRDPLPFGNTIGSIEIVNANGNLRPGESVTVSGFGSTVINGIKPGILHSVNVPIVDQLQCVRAYANYPGRARVSENMFCAGLLGIGGKDACQGDSGGIILSIFNVT